MNFKFQIPVAFLAGAVLIASTAQGYDVSPACPEVPMELDDAKNVAGEWFSKGEILVEEGLFTEAVGAFACSLKMVEHPATYINAAMAAEKGEDKEATLHFYRRYVELAPQGSRAVEARAKVAALEIELEPEEEPEPEPDPQITAEKPAHEVEAKPPLELEPGPSAMLVSGYTLVGVGAAGLVVGAVLQGMAGSARSDGESTSSYDTFKEKKDSMESLQTGATVSFVVGGVAAVAGVVMILVDAKRGDEASPVSVGAYPGGLMIEGSF